MTFAEHAAIWQAQQIHRANTATAIDTSLRVHAIPRFGDRPRASIRPGEVQAFVRDLPEAMKPSTVHVTYQHLRSVFRAAELDRVIARTPCQRITLPHVDKQPVEPLLTETVLALERAMPAPWRAMVTLMAGAGLRPGEAAGVTLDRVDFLRRTLLVDRQLLMRPPRLGPPKTAASVRTVPLPQVVVDALAAHMVMHPTGVDGMLFTSGSRLLNRYHFGKSFRRAAIEVGADGASPHALRHYYASLLIRHGESVKVVQARLGHASARETLDTYSHMWPDSEDLTRSAVDSVLGVAADSLRTQGVAEKVPPQVRGAGASP